MANHRVIHVEDNLSFHARVREAISSLPNVEVSNYLTFHSFAVSPIVDASLYVLDRHFPVRDGQEITDEAWKSTLNYLSVIAPERPVIILSHHPPKSHLWRPRPQVKEAILKDSFDPELFRQKVAHYLKMGGVE